MSLGGVWDFVLAVSVFVIHVAVGARALTRPGRTPASRVAWLAVIMSLPALGILGYLLLGETSIGPERTKKLRDAEDQLYPQVASGGAPYAVTRPPTSAELTAGPIGSAGSVPAVTGQAPGALTRQITDSGAVPAGVSESVFDVVSSINGFPAVGGNRIRVIGDPQSTPHEPKLDSYAAIGALIKDVEQAKHSVHIAVYIWLDDDSGGRLAGAVSAAARRGVSCRVMVDALGSRAFTRSPRWSELKDAGVQAVATLNDIPRLGKLAFGRLDLRNHRKMFVIDNRVAYCGSQNCADPEFRVEAKFAPWIDILLRCQGPIVAQEQGLFLAGWIAETGEASPEISALISEIGSGASEVFDDGSVAAQFGTGPTLSWEAMSDVFVSTVFAAHRELIIVTPYFVPDEALLRAICAAPRRGIETTLVVPKRNNSPLVAGACKSTYGDLLAGGVRLFEYPLGILHSKIIVADQNIALVGSSNVDRRSLQLNFENNMLISDPGVAGAVRERSLGYISVSDEVHAAEVAKWGFGTRLVNNTVALLGPVL